MRLPSPLPAVVLATLSALAATAPADLSAQSPLRDGWEMAAETSPGQRPDDDWIAVTVPATFEDHLGADFDGVCWYRRRLEGNPSPEISVVLTFHGVATAATVYFDGEEVGAHLGAWTPFHVDLTGRLARGGGLLEIRVDEKVGHNTQGFLPVIQPHFGGIWRSVVRTDSTTPRLDRESLYHFGEAPNEAGREQPILHFAARDLAPTPSTFVQHLDVELLSVDGAQVLWSTSQSVSDALDVTRTVRLGDVPVERWSPSSPTLHPLRFTLREGAGGRILDRVERQVGFRDLRTDGTTVLWNDQPLQLRGMLHWGYSPPHFAPPEDAAYWREQLAGIRALGCNLVKACLWVPPRCFYELCDELGLVVWQEYPTWHPTLTAEYLPELRLEYDEFHRYDRSHPSVALRSLTCETGHSAELEVIRALYERCKELTPQTLVVDDSAWISWHRIHDFYDDHPYGNNRWWPGKLQSMREHIAARDAKPLLLGECITSDTWVDLDAWDALEVADDAWWAPWCLAAQRTFEPWFEQQFGAAERAALLPKSLDYALRNRKYQIERLRMSLPDAGYVISVVRDFTKARMGLWDDMGRLKWSPEQWAWHGDTMLCLDTDDDRRAFVAGAFELPVRIAHGGRGALDGELTIGIPELELSRSFAVHDLATGAVSARHSLPVTLTEVTAPRRLRIEARLTGSHPATSQWDVWVHPAPTGTLPDDLRIIERLDAATVDWIRAGGRALLLAGEREDSLRTSGMWFLKGAPFAPHHAVSAACPPEFLEHLQAFDLEAGRVLAWDPWLDQVDPLLGFWDTHDIRDVNRWLLAFTCGFGEGRLGATVLDHDTAAGRYVLEHLARALTDGPPPGRAWRDETIDALRGVLTAETIDLTEWKIALDPEDQGLAQGWAAGRGEPAWRPIRVGAHWEAQGIEQYDGVAWYETSLTIPQTWPGDGPIHLAFEGVDDSYHLYLDGEQIGRFGDPATGETVWLVRTSVDLRPHVQPGGNYRITLRVVDHVGAGGIHRPVFVTTGPLDAQSTYVH